jgi:hypothetical protein
MIQCVLFVAEDMQKRTEWFFKSGYREWKEALERYKRDYRLSPEWKNFINQLETFVTNPPAFGNLTSDEISDTNNKIKYWPNPGKMPRSMDPTYSATECVSFLKDWFYKALSGQSHLSLHGFVEIGKFFAKEVMTQTFGEKADEVLEKDIERFRNDQIWIAIILVIVLSSEMEMHFRFGMGQELKYLWTLILTGNDLTKDLYERFYKNL